MIEILTTYLSLPQHLFKIGLLILLGMAIIFAGIIVSQIRAMNKIVSMPTSEAILQTFGIILLIVAIFLFTLAVAIL